MTLILVITENEDREDDWQDIDYDVLTSTYLSRTSLSLENGTRLEFRPPTAAAKGWDADVVILRADVTQEYYDKVVKKAGAHGVIIDESRRISED